MATKPNAAAAAAAALNSPVARGRSNTSQQEGAKEEVKEDSSREEDSKKSDSSRSGSNSRTSSVMNKRTKQSRAAEAAYDLLSQAEDDSVHPDLDRTTASFRFPKWVIDAVDKKSRATKRKKADVLLDFIRLGASQDPFGRKAYDSACQKAGFDNDWEQKEGS